MLKGGKGVDVTPQVFIDFFQDDSALAPAILSQLFVRHLNIFLIFQVLETYFLNHYDFGVYVVVQTNFAFQFPHTTKFRLVLTCASDRTKESCSCFLYFISYLPASAASMLAYIRTICN